MSTDKEDIEEGEEALVDGEEAVEDGEDVKVALLNVCL